MAYRKVRSRPPITQERLKELVHYDPQTGLFTSIKKRRGCKLGSILGTPIGRAEYLVIGLDYQLYYAHRLAWFYMTGEWPDPEVDHENGRRADNRWANLREATVVEQRQNRGGVLGAYQDKRRGTWHPSIRINGKRTNLGTFPTAEAAHAAYVEAKARLHPFQPTVRALEP